MKRTNIVQVYESTSPSSLALIDRSPLCEARDCIFPTFWLRLFFGIHPRFGRRPGRASHRPNERGFTVMCSYDSFLFSENEYLCPSGRFFSSPSPPIHNTHTGLNTARSELSFLFPTPGRSSQLVLLGSRGPHMNFCIECRALGGNYAIRGGRFARSGYPPPLPWPELPMSNEILFRTPRRLCANNLCRW